MMTATRNAMAEAEALFIRRWGEMAAGWGISRTMAEIHALLYLAPDPLCMDDMMERLAISRGNASMNLRQLVNWGLIQRLHRRGDRREYFQAETDVWQMFETIVRERKRREIEPILDTLERCRTLISRDRATPSKSAAANADQYDRKFAAILEFFTTMNGAFEAMFRLGPRGVSAAARFLQEYARKA